MISASLAASVTATRTGWCDDHLNDWACQAPRVYYHHWTVGGVVVWDNRRLMHRATTFDMSRPRRVWHTRIAGEFEPELAVNHA